MVRAAPLKCLALAGCLFVLSLACDTQLVTKISFPEKRPRGGSFSRPRNGEALTVTPPGFCWWRAAPRGQAAYRLKVLDENGSLVYASQVLSDPVAVPERVLPAGDYDLFLKDPAHRIRVRLTDGEPVAGFLMSGHRALQRCRHGPEP